MCQAQTTPWEYFGDIIAYVLLNFTSTGQGPPIILLHGIAGSLRYWNDIVPLLAGRHRVIAIDLLGFGRSPHPKSDYSRSTHVKSIKETLDTLKLKEPAILVGHSMGALIALSFAAAYPDTIRTLILLNPPVFENKAQAIQDITQGKKLLQYAYYGWSSRLLCTIWCTGLRPISKHIASLYLRKLPHHVAQDSVLHSWEAYSKSLSSIVENQTINDDLLQITIPITILHGDQESSVVLKNIKKLKDNLKTKNNLIIKAVRGSHHLPLSQPQVIVETILDHASQERHSLPPRTL